ncbi:dentin sialophosphoprotein [Eurosta solidaginis]|uniref:dentin sialophosphoprotein n=1 Tax=Eurosta solidaginis TaxID=178769 RepID=UPI003531202B
MSNLLFMDETNCNGVYAVKGNNAIATTLTTSNNNISNGNGNDNSNNITLTGNTSMSNINNSNSSTSNIISNTNNINNINIMNVAASTVAMTAAVANANAIGNGIAAATLPTSVSNEDLSQSLSEYTDADESISAPTEFLAEFLSAVMLKDYKKALKYCKLILQYEPNNATAKEFYPLIIEKLRDAPASDSDENYNKSSSPEPVLELQSSDPYAVESDEAAFEDQHIGLMDDGIDEYGLAEDNCNSLGGSNSHELNVSSSQSDSCDSAGGSLSESVNDDDGEEEDVDDEDVCDIDDDDDDIDDDEDDDDVEDVISSSGDDLPNDDPNSIGAAAGTGNNSLSSRNSSSGGGGGGRSRSDNTTHSYSSLLLEEEDDIASVNLKFTKELPSPDLDVSNGNKLPSTSCSESESPTEPLTQRLAAILRSKCGVSSAADNY